MIKTNSRRYRDWAAPPGTRPPRRRGRGVINRLIHRLLVGAVLAVACHAAAAQSDAASPVSNQLANLQNSLDIIDAGLQRQYLTNADLASNRQQVDFVTDSARRIRARAEEKLQEKQRLLDALGPKPKESESPEPPQVANERQKLEAAVSDYQAQIKTANVVLARADELRAQLAREGFGVLARVLGQQTETPLAPGLIAAAVSEVPAQLRRSAQRISHWWSGLEFDRERFGTLMWWLVLLVVVLAVMLPTRKWVLRRYGPDHRDDSPSFTRRFRVMLAIGLGKVVLPVISIAGLYVVLVQSGAPTREVHHMVWIPVVSLCQFFLVTGLSAAAMSPGYPEWRISHFTNDSAVRLHRSIRLFAFAVLLLNLLSIPITDPEYTREFAEILVVDVTRDALHTLFGAVVVVLIAVSMLNILRGDRWWFVHLDETGERTTAGPGRFVHVFFWVAKLGLTLSVGAALIGYVNLGLFLSQRIVWSLLLVAFAYLLRAFIAAICSQAAGEESDVGGVLRKTLGYSSSGAGRLMFWVMLLVDIVLSVAAIIFLLLIWGVHATDIYNAATELLFGIDIGNYTLSLVDIGVALGVFVLLFIGVRLFQSFLSNRVLAQTVPDVGVRDALTTGVGYAGIIIAAIVAISSLGLELSQLAIIFGALSVGIGFGLQHVVSNFVSGLILLMHRPIKAGDWIVVGQHQGYVKKINVVSTEIQTFDNADVIVPNSQLVSSEVLNWTHKSTVARVIVAVTVAYGSDPRQVRDVLLECANNSDDVLKMPAPIVVFRSFGENGLDFELRFFIRQADYMLITASDLRFAITDAFRAAGIGIPFPQRDVHIKSSESGGRSESDGSGVPDSGRRRQESRGGESGDQE